MPNSPQSVLVVDPDLNIRLLAEASLRRAGFRVLAAATETAALDLCQRHRDEIALALVEYGGNGKLAAGLRALEPSVPVAFLSAYEPRGVREPVVLTPFRPRDLVTTVKQLLATERGTPLAQSSAVTSR